MRGVLRVRGEVVPEDAPMPSPTTFVRLHHVALPIPPGEEDRFRAYYVDALGLEEVHRPASIPGVGCWFRGGQVEIHLTVEEGPRAQPRAHPGLLVADLDALAARLAAAGWRTDWDEAFPGHRRFYSYDPLGNRLEFLEPLA